MTATQLFATTGLCICLTAALLFAAGHVPLTSRSRTIQAGAVLFIALVLRVVFGAIYSPNYDLQSYFVIGQSLHHGTDIFAAGTISRTNYIPFVAWWWDLVSPLGHAHRHLYEFVVKLPYEFCDAVIAGLLVLITAGPSSRRAGWIYAVNPLTIAVCSLEGMFDAAVVLPLLASLVFISRKPGKAGLLIGAAVAVKTWALFFIPSLLVGLRPRLWPRVLEAASIIPLAACLFYFSQYRSNVAPALLHIFGYSGGHGAGLGTALLVATHPNLHWLPTLLNVISIGGLLLGIYLGWKRRMAPADSVSTAMFLLLILAPATAPQYLMWPVAFLLFGGRVRASMILITGSFATVAISGLHIPITTGDLIAPVAATASLVAALIYLLGDTAAPLSTARAASSPSSRE